MKVICIVSHEKPLGDGRFQKYEAGQEYEVEKYDKSYFELIKENKEIKKGGKKESA